MVGKLHILTVAAGLSLTACAAPMQNATPPAAGRVTWVVHDTYGSLLNAYSAAPGRKAFRHVYVPGKLGAFATWNGLLADGGYCEIHTMFPGNYATAWALGEDMAHEFRHCVEGAFHD